MAGQSKLSITTFNVEKERLSKKFKLIAYATKDLAKSNKGAFPLLFAKQFFRRKSKNDSTPVPVFCFIPSDAVTMREKIMDEMSADDKCVFEVIGDICQFYMDLDMSKEQFNQFPDTIHQVLNSTDITFKEKGFNILDKVMVFTSHSDYKYSYHIIIHGYQCTKSQAHSIFGLIRNNVYINYPGFKDANELKPIMDHSVYTKDRCFRLLHCSKIGQNRPKVIDYELSRYSPPCENDDKSDLPLREFEASLISLVNLKWPSFSGFPELNNTIIKHFNKHELTTEFFNFMIDSYENWVNYCPELEPRYSYSKECTLFRTAPSKCPCCGRNHDNQNASLYYSKGFIYFRCFQLPKGKPGLQVIKVPKDILKLYNLDKDFNTDDYNKKESVKKTSEKDIIKEKLQESRNASKQSKQATLPYDRNDDFYWIDFVLKYAGVVFKPEANGLDLARRDVARVIRSIKGGKRVICVKHSKEEPYKIRRMFSREELLEDSILQEVLTASEDDKDKVEPSVISIPFKWIFNNNNSICVDSFNFAPDIMGQPAILPRGQFNIFPGYQAKLVWPIDQPMPPEMLARIDFIKAYMISVFDNFDYLISWLAYSLRTGKKTEVCPIFRGEMGAGKDCFFVKLGELVYGRKLYTHINDPNLITQKFNGAMNSKMFIHMSEARRVKGSAEEFYEKFKDMITNHTITIELKNIDPFDIDDFVNYILTTNNDAVMPIDDKDRRFLIITVLSTFLGNREFFNNFHESFTQEVADIFYSYLLGVDIMPHLVKDILTIPETEGRAMAKELSENPIDAFYNRIFEGEKALDSKYIHFPNREDGNILPFISTEDLYGVLFIPWYRDEYPESKIPAMRLFVGRLKAGIKVKKDLFYDRPFIEKVKVRGFFINRSSCEKVLISHNGSIMNLAEYYYVINGKTVEEIQQASSSIAARSCD